MTTEELEQKQNELLEEMVQFAKDNNLSDDKIEPITDGVPDIEGYLNSYPKIMWILKEPYETDAQGNPEGGGWSQIEFIRNRQCGDIQTWQMICYIMSAIRKHCNYKSLRYISEDPTLLDNLQSIAFANLSKMPYKPNSSMSRLKESYTKWKDIVAKQIDLYDPDVIIFGNTYSLVTEIGGLFTDSVELPSTDRGYLDIRSYNGKLLLNAYHPSRKGQKYADLIIDAVNKYFPSDSTFSVTARPTMPKAQR